MLTSDARNRAATGRQRTRIDGREFEHAAISDVGHHRDINEDYYLIAPEHRLVLIADGMGGHAAGEVASRIAAESVAHYFEQLDDIHHQQSTSRHLVEAIKIANSALFQKVRETPQLEGMGTTVAALVFTADLAVWAHVGDSRILRLRGDELKALTRDHSLLEQTIRRQQLEGEEAEQFAQNFPYRNVVTRALGSRWVVEVDVDSAPLADGDLFVLTTDGVHDVIEPNSLRQLVRHHAPDCEMICRALVDETLQADAPDNLAVACVRAEESR